MKVSECHLCEHYEVDQKNRNDRCKLMDGKLIVSITCCPKTDPVKPWRNEDTDRLKNLLKSGTHLRNIALIMNRTYTNIEEKMSLIYMPSEEERSCLNCSRSGYCHKQYVSGCGLDDWKPLTPNQIKDRILMETRKDGLSFNY